MMVSIDGETRLWVDGPAAANNRRRQVKDFDLAPQLCWVDHLWQDRTALEEPM